MVMLMSWDEYGALPPGKNTTLLWRITLLSMGKLTNFRLGHETQQRCNKLSEGNRDGFSELTI